MSAQQSEIVRCNHDGGRGIGAGHICRCVLLEGHSMKGARPHGCGCGAMWADEVSS